MHHADRHAAQHQTVGRFQAQQAAADDHGVFIFHRRVDHGVGVRNVAVGDHAFKVFAGNGQDEGIGASTQQQAVVFGADFLADGIFGMHHAANAVYRSDFPARMQGDVIVLVPVPWVEHNFVERLLAGQHGGQQNAVVVGMRLGTEHGDVIEIGRNLEKLLQGANTCHAVADHHEFHFALGLRVYVHGHAAFSTWACRVYKKSITSLR